MADTSTFITFKQAVIDALEAKTGAGGDLEDVQVAYGWPGPNAARELIAWGNVADLEHAIPTIKSGRKQRQETLRVPLVVWVFHPDATPLTVKSVEERAFALLGPVEDTFADTPQVVDAVQWAAIDDGEVVTVPYDKGWAVAVTVNVQVNARLT